MGGSEACKASSSSLVDEKVGGLRRCNWREGGRGGGPLVPPSLGLGGKGGGGESWSDGGISLETAGTEFSMDMGGGGEKSGGSMCNEVEVVSGKGTLLKDCSAIRVSSKSSRSKSGAISVALGE